MRRDKGVGTVGNPQVRRRRICHIYMGAWYKKITTICVGTLYKYENIYMGNLYKSEYIYMGALYKYGNTYMGDLHKDINIYVGAM